MTPWLMALEGSRVSVDGARGPAPGRRPRVEGRAAVRAGFTIIELLVSLLVLSLLVSLLVVAVNRARSSAGIAAERQSVSAMKTGVELFQQEFGFLPPMVKDNSTGKYAGYDAPNSSNGPLDDGEPVVFSTGDEDDLEFLRGGEIDDPEDEDYRFSEYSLAYYLIGVLDENEGGRLIDGVAGPGFRAPRRDGTFERSGREFGPFFSPGRRGGGVVATDTLAGRFELRDANGVAYRYYRWEQGDPETGELEELPEDYNVPAIVGDAGEELSLRSARFAIVAAGPNGAFGDWTEGGPDAWRELLGRSLSDEAIERRAREDNVVEVGK